MRHLVRTLCWCTTLLYACQQPSETLTPNPLEGARVAPKRTVCDSRLSVKIKSPVKDIDRLFLFEAMYVGRNGKDSSLAASVYQQLTNGAEIVLSGLAYNKQVRLRFYENELDKTKFVSSGLFASCGQPSADFDLRAVKLPAITPITFQVKFPCTDVEQNRLPKIVTVEYRLTGTSFWFPLASLRREDVKKNVLQTTTTRLVKGRTYDVQLNALGLMLSQNATLVDKDVWEVPVNTKLFCK